MPTNGVPLRVRCGLPLGTDERRDDDYFGRAVNRAARIMSVAHGGQVLLSRALARRYHLNCATVRKWRKRDTTNDRPSAPRPMHTTLSVAQEAIVVALRESLLLPLDDLLVVTRESSTLQ